MPNLRPLAQKYIDQLQRQLKQFPSQQASAAVEKLALALERYVTRRNDRLLHTFQQVRDELAELQLTPLQAICQAFLSEANQRINLHSNQQHALVSMPFEILGRIFVPPEKKIDLPLFFLLSQVSQKFYRVVRSILASYYPQLDYTSAPDLFRHHTCR